VLARVHLLDGHHALVVAGHHAGRFRGQAD
jgi:hypothetical protein